MSKRSSSLRVSLLAIAPLALALFASACAAAPAEDELGESGDALSQSECNKLVTASIAKSTAECKRKETDSDAKFWARTQLETAVVASLNGFVEEITSYTGAGASAVGSVVAECSKIGCTGELGKDGEKAACNVEKALLQGACYVRHVSEVISAATDLDLSDNVAKLKTSVTNITENWVPYTVQAKWLQAQHKACSTYVGSAVQKSKLNATCRASCNESDAMSVSKINEGHYAACAPAGHEEVKDDLGKLVECGSYQRPFLKLGTVCECADTPACTQFSTLGASSERGKSCGTGKSKKLVWNDKDSKASLECR
jgi:hypothetical protein